MPESNGDNPDAPLPPPLAEAEGAIVRQFVEHWGMMARSWGINSTMGELFALLYITGTDWAADDLRNWLRVSRGNVSMNLRELLAWGVVHKVHRPGERREFFVPKLMSGLCFDGFSANANGGSWTRRSRCSNTPWPLHPPSLATTCCAIDCPRFASSSA